MPDEYYIGLMSGTSTDGVDGVLADLRCLPYRILARAGAPLPEALRAELLALNVTGADELARAARAANALADCYVAVVGQLLADARLPAGAVRAIGAHGQTVRHVPEESYTIQLNAPARLAEKTGIAVVADFRSRDIAAGGQGAPLVPAFHAACFGLGAHRAVLNLGGIANLTLLDPLVRGFDTGPANMLLDAWAQRHLGTPYDRDGAWAAQGTCHAGLLAALGRDPWFSLPPPKSTGRDHFNLNWLQAHLQRLDDPIQAVDVQRTLLQLSVQTIRDALQNHAPGTREILVCGGGALNPLLMQALGDALPVPIHPTDDEGVPAMAVEALAFAWLAQAHLQGLPACLPQVTGARHATIAGCLYPAH